MIWRMISSSISCESTSLALSKLLKLDWCSIALGGTTSRLADVTLAWLLVPDRSSALLVPVLLSLLCPLCSLLSLLRLSRGGSK